LGNNRSGCKVHHQKLEQNLLILELLSFFLFYVSLKLVCPYQINIVGEN
jgi:hypothetical protein